MSSKLIKRIGANVQRRRKAIGLTVEQLADRGSFTKGYLSEIENCKKLPSLLMLEKIADALKVDIKDLF